MSASLGTRSASPSPQGTRIHVLDLLDGAETGLEGPAFAAARQRAVAKTITLGGSERGGAELEFDRRAHELLVCTGFVLREVTIGGHTIAELVGPGDVLLTQSEPAGPASFIVSLRTVGTAQLALLDEEFNRRAAAWPGIGAALLRRAGDRADRSSIERAMLAVPSVELRVLLFLGHYAAHWGRVRPDGFIVPIVLTHDMLGRLIGARRPTVTTAISRLRARGALEQRPDRTWLLSPLGAAALSSDALAGTNTGDGATRVDRTTTDGPLGPAILSQRLQDQRQRLARVRERHESALATMRDRAQLLHIRAEELRSGLRAVERAERDRS